MHTLLCFCIIKPISWVLSKLPSIYVVHVITGVSIPNLSTIVNSKMDIYKKRRSPNGERHRLLQQNLLPAIFI